MRILEESRQGLMTNTKRWLRRIVVATSFPPFLQVYRWIYWMVIRLAVGMFRKEPKMRAVYLRRGYAKKEWIPGISDLDFQIFVDGLDGEGEKSLRRRYSRFARLAVLPDESLGVIDMKNLSAALASPTQQYRLMEGRATWMRVYGTDLLAALPNRPIEDMIAGLYTELRIWWTIFAWQLLQLQDNRHEPISRNNICYKVAAEVVKVKLALERGTLTFLRSQALQLAKESLSEGERRFVDKLEAISKGRFLRNDERLVDQTLSFVCSNLDEVYTKGFRASALFTENPTIKVDYAEDERLWDRECDAHVRTLLEHVRENWAAAYEGAYLVACDYLELDELALVVAVDPLHLPSAEQLSDLYHAHMAAGPRQTSRIALYILLRNIALQIDVDYYKRGWRSVLSPLVNADFFELLRRPECALDGKRPPPCAPLVWTRLAKEFRRHRRRLLLQSLESPEAQELDNLQLVRQLWKVAQLGVTGRSVDRGDVVYPLTIPAILRGFAAEGKTPPSEFYTLAEVYRGELRGTSRDIKALLPAAVAYLKHLESTVPAPGE
jgi:hypothetical protein